MNQLSPAHPCPWRLVLLLLAAVIAPARGQLVLKLSVLDAPVLASSRIESKARALNAKTIRLGEPLSVRVELVNTGAQPVDVRSSLDPAAGFLSLQLGPTAASAQRFTATRWEIKDMMVRTRPLAAGAKLVHETFLFGKMDSTFRETYLLENEGTYLLRAVFDSQDPAVHVESNTVLVKVGPSVPGWEELKKARIVDLMEGRLGTHREMAEAMTKMESIVSRQAQHPLKEWTAEKHKSLPSAAKALLP